MNPDCHYGDHTWNGTSQCVRCGQRLRCGCGVYVREDNMDGHVQRCPRFERLARKEGRI